MIKIIGLAMLIVGMGLAYWGYQISGSISSQITETMTGAPKDKVMVLYIAGAVSFFVGVLLFIKK